MAWSGPRTVVIPRTANGFGFTLRHFIVYPSVAETPAPRQVLNALCDLLEKSHIVFYH